MKTCVLGLSLVALLGTLPAIAETPEPCSVRVAITGRVGSFRPWVNVFEALALERNGLKACQGDEAVARVNVDEADWRRLLNCPAEFHLKLNPVQGSETRRVVISKAGKVLFQQTYTNDFSSQRILRQVPSCAALQAMAAGGR